MNSATKLQELRQKEHATQSEMASKVGLSKSAWAMYEAGKRRPRDEVKLKIAKCFGRTVEELFF